LYLNGFRKNLASNLGRFLSSDGYSYAFSSDRPTLFAIFTLIFVLFMNYPGWHLESASFGSSI
jgi:hypothetical protein